MNRRAFAGLFLIGITVCLVAGTARIVGADPGFSDSPDNQALAYGFPKPIVPADNPLTAPKVRLGELLFGDKRLSLNSTRSCASCHIPDLYFTDALPRPRGALGELLMFNTPTLINSAYSTSFSWIDKGLESLEQQHTGPLTNETPVEMGMGEAQLKTLSEDAALKVALRRAFPSAERFEETHVVKALASYIRTLIRGDSPFDRYLFEDDSSALTQQAQSGLVLFSSPRLNCVACHRGFLVSGPTRSTRAQFNPSFYRTGVSGSTLAFRVPSLRFVKHTAPYMHDGSQQTLQQVISFYASGGAAPAGSEAAKKLMAFSLTVEEHGALLAFLKSL